MQESHLTKINTLVQQLDLVRHLATSEYWLTTEELCLLLELDTNALELLKTKEPLFQFAWRNFVCTFVSHQSNTKLWQITIYSPPQAPIKTNVEQSEKAYAATSLIPHNAYNDSGSSSNLTQSQHLTRSSQASVGSNAPDDVLPSHYVQIQNFLTPEELEQLFNFVLQQEPNFVPTSNSANDPDYRRSMFLPVFAPFAELVTARIQTLMSQVMQHLNMQPFQVQQIESQLTLHNDGNYYKIHNDSGSPDTANRELTYVYYFHGEPKLFSGGELLIYDSRIENNFYVAAKSYKTVQPLNNSIVFFLSRYMHEVLTVSCPSKAFADSRFTINGWVRRVN